MDYVRDNIEATIDFAKMLKRAEPVEAASEGETSITPMVIGLRTDARRLVINARPLEIDDDTPLPEVTREKSRVFAMAAWAMRIWGARDVLFLSDSYFRQPDEDDDRLGEVQEEDLELPLSKDPRSTEAIVVAHIQADSNQVFVTPYHYEERGVVFDETGLMPHQDEGMISGIFRSALMLTDKEIELAMQTAPGGPFDQEGFFTFLGRRGYLVAEFGGDMRSFDFKTWMGEGDDDGSS